MTLFNIKWFWKFNAIILKQKNSIKSNDLVIKFIKKGCLQNPNFHIVVTKKNTNNSWKFVEKLGYFNPKFTERRFILNSQRLAFWVKNGVKLQKNIKKYFIKFLVF